MKDGGGKRYNKGKLEFSVLPVEPLIGVTKVLQFGAKKYGENNWQRGMKWSICFDCAIRHLYKWWYLREENDTESGLHHLWHAGCNLFFLIWYSIRYKKGDDRPEINKEDKKELLKMWEG